MWNIRITGSVPYLDRLWYVVFGSIVSLILLLLCIALLSSSFFFLFSLFCLSSISVASSVFVTVVVRHRRRPSLLSFCYPRSHSGCCISVVRPLSAPQFRPCPTASCLLVVGLAAVELYRSFIRLSVSFDSSSVCFSHRRPIRPANRSGRWFGRCPTVSIFIVVWPSVAQLLQPLSSYSGRFSCFSDVVGHSYRFVYCPATLTSLHFPIR